MSNDDKNNENLEVTIEKIDSDNLRINICGKSSGDIGENLIGFLKHLYDGYLRYTKEKSQIKPLEQTDDKKSPSENIEDVISKSPQIENNDKNNNNNQENYSVPKLSEEPFYNVSQIAQLIHDNIWNVYNKSKNMRKGPHEHGTVKIGKAVHYFLDDWIKVYPELEQIVRLKDKEKTIPKKTEELKEPSSDIKPLETVEDRITIDASTTYLSTNDIAILRESTPSAVYQKISELKRSEKEKDQTLITNMENHLKREGAKKLYPYDIWKRLYPNLPEEETALKKLGISKNKPSSKKLSINLGSIDSLDKLEPTEKQSETLESEITRFYEPHQKYSRTEIVNLTGIDDEEIKKIMDFSFSSKEITRLMDTLSYTKHKKTKYYGWVWDTLFRECNNRLPLKLKQRIGEKIFNPHLKYSVSDIHRYLSEKNPDQNITTESIKDKLGKDFSFSNEGWRVNLALKDREIYIPLEDIHINGMLRILPKELSKKMAYNIAKEALEKQSKYSIPVKDIIKTIDGKEHIEINLLFYLANEIRKSRS